MTMEKMSRQNKDLISDLPKIKPTESEKGRRMDKRPKPPNEKLMMRKKETLRSLGQAERSWVDSVARNRMYRDDVQRDDKCKYDGDDVDDVDEAVRTTLDKRIGSKGQVASFCEQKFGASYYSVQFSHDSHHHKTRFNLLSGNKRFKELEISP